MSPRIRMLIVLATGFGWSLFCGWIGWNMRDSRADATAAKVEVAAQTGRANVIERARAADHANEQHAANVEQQRIDSVHEIEFVFNTIEAKAIEYVRANPVPAGCALIDDGLRAWAAANAGRLSTIAEPGDKFGSLGALPGRDFAAEERKP